MYSPLLFVHNANAEFPSRSPIQARLVGFFASALVVLMPLACSSKHAPPKPKACTAFGQQCEYAPGKLGACVIRDGCTGEGCYVCQSQH
ncbi:MAG TPA: hypothetical protein VIM73_09795 [Polyangiaceae bacterium]